MIAKSNKNLKVFHGNPLHVCQMPRSGDNVWLEGLATPFCDLCDEFARFDTNVGHEVFFQSLSLDTLEWQKLPHFTCIFIGGVFGTTVGQRIKEVVANRKGLLILLGMQEAIHYTHC